jgi:hypothetical protein
MDQSSSSGAWSLAPPEAAGMRIAFRTAWPPALAIAGTVPLLAARSVFRKGTGDVVAAAQGAGGIMIAVLILVGGWLRYREDIKAWWRRQADLAGMRPGAPAQEGETS